MPNREWLEQLIQQARSLPLQQKIAIGATAFGSLVFFLWIIAGAQSTEYQLLYGGMQEDEVAKVIEVLDEQKVPYKLEDNGGAIFVPADQVPGVRIHIAGKGVPLGGSPGFEIFDRSSFGVTDFVHRVNYRRGLQGELERSIEQLDPVDRSRVHLAIPERSPFVGAAERHPTASVVVKLKEGQDLDPQQTQSIVHLVASSVESLERKRITVVDDRGRLLAPIGDQGPGARAPAGSMTYQDRIEKDLSKRIVSLLERTVGIGRVVAHVRADVDWTESETTEERFDPDSQVARSEQTQTESSSERLGDVGGIPGAVGNTPDLVDISADTVTAASKETETINYEISKTVTHSVSPVGNIERLSVAVLLDGKPIVPAADGEAVEASFTPWNEDEIGTFENLVKQVVGFQEERGDVITVTSAPFQTIDVGEEPSGWVEPQMLRLITTVVRQFALLVAVVLFGLFVIRPLLMALGITGGGPLVESEDELEAELLNLDQLRAEFGAQLPEHVDDESDGSEESEEIDLSLVARERSDDTVKIIRSWIEQG